MLHVAPVRSNLFAGKERLDANLKLRSQNLPPGQHPLHQGPHTQLAGDGQGLVQQGDGLGTVPLSVALS